MSARDSRGFEVLEHTADVGLHVWADTLAGLLAESGRALFSLMGEITDGPRLSERVDLEPPDLEALVEMWLSELLYLYEGRGMAPTRFDVDVSQDPLRVAGVVSGTRADALVQHGPAVKAVTYHRLRVERTQDGIEAWVYLDV